VVLGLEARAGGHVVFALAGGTFTSWHEGLELLGPWFFYQAQVTFLFDLLPAAQDSASLAPHEP
jgi:hypothetical protein